MATATPNIESMTTPLTSAHGSAKSDGIRQTHLLPDANSAAAGPPFDYTCSTEVDLDALLLQFSGGDKVSERRASHREKRKERKKKWKEKRKQNRQKERDEGDAKGEESAATTAPMVASPPKTPANAQMSTGEQHDRSVVPSKKQYQHRHHHIDNPLSTLSPSAAFTYTIAPSTQTQMNYDDSPSPPPPPSLEPPSPTQISPTLPSFNTATPTPTSQKPTCFFWYHGSCARHIHRGHCNLQHALTSPLPTMVQPPPGYVHRSGPCGLEWCAGDDISPTKRRRGGGDGEKGRRERDEGLGLRRAGKILLAMDDGDGDGVEDGSDARVGSEVPSCGQPEPEPEWFLQGFEM